MQTSFIRTILKDRLEAKRVALDFLLKTNNYFAYFIVLSILAMIIFISVKNTETENTLQQNDVSDLSLFKKQLVASANIQPTEDKTPIKKTSNQKIEPENKIITCKRLSFYPDDFSESMDLLDKWNERFKKQLEYANLKEKSLATLVFFDDNTKGKIQFLENFLKKNSDNSLAYWELLQICETISSSRNHCDENMLENAIRSDPENGAFLSQIASIKYQQGDIEGATNAYQKLIETNSFDIYWGQYAKLYLTTMLNVGYENNHQTKMQAFGFFSSSPIPNYSPLLDYCKEQAALNIENAQLCLDIGKNMVTNSKSYISSQMGYGIQSTVHRITENKVALANVEKAKEQSDYQVQKLLREKANVLLDHDDLLFDLYFNSLFLNGERIANKHLIEEAIRLSKNPDYNPCPE